MLTYILRIHFCLGDLQMTKTMADAERYRLWQEKMLSLILFYWGGGFCQYCVAGGNQV